MAELINFNTPDTRTCPILIGDPVQATGGSPDGLPTMTASVGVNVSACLELQSTASALLLSRMTTTQQNAIVTPSNGMLIYNTTTNLLTAYLNGAWTSIESSGAAGVFTSVTSGLGTAAAPSYTFTGRTDVGLYSSAAHTLDLTANGTRQVSIIGTALAVDYLTITGGATTTNTVTITTAGTDANIGITLTPKGTGALLNAVGAIATPSYSFTGDASTGIWHSAASTIDFSTAGSEQFQIVNTATAVNWISVTGCATGLGLGAGPGFIANGTDVNIDITVVPKGTGSLAVRGATNPGGLTLWNQTNTFATTIESAAVTSNLSWVWPLTDATPPAGGTVASVAMTSNGSGVLSFSLTGSNYAKGTLSAANINSMYTTGIQLLAAPGNGFAILIDYFVLELVGATSFAAGGVVYLNYSTTGHGTTLASQIMPVTAITVANANNTICSASGLISNTVTPSSEGVQLISTSVANQAVAITNATQLFTTGTGTANWYIWYSVIPVS